MRQIDARPPNRLVALEEVVTAVRTLLAGEETTTHGSFVHLDGVRLAHVPDPPPRILIGTTGPRALAAAGRSADGVLLAEGSGPGAPSPGPRDRRRHGGDRRLRLAEPGRRPRRRGRGAAAAGRGLAPHGPLPAAVRAGGARRGAIWTPTACVDSRWPATWTTALALSRRCGTRVRTAWWLCRGMRTGLRRLRASSLTCFRGWRKNVNCAGSGYGGSTARPADCRVCRPEPDKPDNRPARASIPPPCKPEVRPSTWPNPPPSKPQLSPSARPRARRHATHTCPAPDHATSASASARSSPAPLDAITDVEGIRVGSVTLIEGDGPLQRGKGPVRTGVTAVLPRGRGDDGRRAPASPVTTRLNGNGEMTGIAWVEESGLLEGPVLITNTNAVGVLRDAVIQYAHRRWGRRRGIKVGL